MLLFLFNKLKNKQNQKNDSYTTQDATPICNEIILDSLTPFARQKNWKTPTKFPLTPNKENITAAEQQGYTFIALGMDTWFIANGVKASLEMFNGKNTDN